MRKLVVACCSAAILAGVGLTVSVSAAPPAPTARALNYPAPKTQAETKAWPLIGGHWNVMRPGDPNSPRAYSGYTGPKWGAHSFETAVDDIATTGIQFTGKPTLETLDAWTSFDGRTNKIMLEPTRLNGQPAVLFMEISRAKGSDQFVFFAIEAPEPVFRSWGGVARMMVLRQLVPSMESIPAEHRAQMARAPLSRQVAYFDAAQTQLFNALAPGLIMSQAQTLMRMRELNHDLLMGNDITDPGIGSNRSR